MRICLLSDLHIDINKWSSNNRFGFEKEKFLNKNDVIIISGDICGSYYLLRNFLNNINKMLYNTKLVFILGNHEFYDSNIEGIDKTSAIEYLKKEYDKDNNITFLENDYIEINNKIILGCTLYTDFLLNGGQEFNKAMANMYINDFKNVYIRSYKVVRKVTPEDYIKYNKKSVRYIQNTCKKNKNKDIIIATHFLPSKKCIGSYYTDDILNPFYCSDLEYLIHRNPNIKLWCYGHSHEQKDFIINNTRLVNASYGYFQQVTFRPSDNKIPLDKYCGKIIYLD